MNSMKYPIVLLVVVWSVAGILSILADNLIVASIALIGLVLNAILAPLVVIVEWLKK